MHWAGLGQVRIPGICLATRRARAGPQKRRNWIGGSIGRNVRRGHLDRFQIRSVAIRAPIATAIARAAWRSCIAGKRAGRRDPLGRRLAAGARALPCRSGPCCRSCVQVPPGDPAGFDNGARAWPLQALGSSVLLASEAFVGGDGPATCVALSPSLHLATGRMIMGTRQEAGMCISARPGARAGAGGIHSTPAGLTSWPPPTRRFYADGRCGPLTIDPDPASRLP